jgi:hypothetical protein
MTRQDTRHLVLVMVVLLALAYHFGGQHKAVELQASAGWFQAGYDCQRLGTSDRYICQ